MDYPQEHIKPYGEDGKKSEQDDEMSSGFQHAAHFRQPFVQPFEVADTERYGYSIERVIGK